MGWRNTVLAVGLLSMVSGAAQAGPAINLTAPGFLFPGDLYTLGFEFTVKSDETIVALGVYDNLQNGLGNPASLGLWDTSGTLLTSATLGAGLTGTLIGNFRYAPIAPFLLQPGTNYVVGTYLPSNSLDPLDVGDWATSFNIDSGSGTGSVDANVNIIAARYSFFDSLFSFPTESSIDGLGNIVPGAWLGGNFTDSLEQGTDVHVDPAPPVATPEPASIALFGAGLAAIRLWRRRKRA